MNIENRVNEGSLQVLLDELRDMLREQQRLLPAITMSIVNAQRDMAVDFAALLREDPLLEPLQRTQDLLQRIKKLEQKVCFIKASEQVSRELHSMDEEEINNVSSSPSGNEEPAPRPASAD